MVSGMLNGRQCYVWWGGGGDGGVELRSFLKPNLPGPQNTRKWVVQCTMYTLDIMMLDHQVDQDQLANRFSSF